eukprot:m.167228 g.167228  ORF g.167228 m.167228 type:complete len:1159 (-) comp31460_c1_seq1:326-3802(-)
MEAVMNPNGTLSCIGVEADCVPSILAKQYPNAKYLDVSFGKIETFEEIAPFTCLKALIADQNNVSSLDSFPVMPHLHTLSLNKNNIDNLDVLLQTAQGKFPKLAFISLINNQCCPMEMIGATQEQYDDYRFQLLKKIPSLRFIDSKPVLDHERPKDVETISQKKLRTGQISTEEYAHILKMHSMIESLDSEDTTDPEDMVDDNQNSFEYTPSLEQEYFASLLEAARDTSSHRLDTTAINDLSVFEKIVQSQVTAMSTTSTLPVNPKPTQENKPKTVTAPPLPSVPSSYDDTVSSPQTLNNNSDSKPTTPTTPTTPTPGKSLSRQRTQRNVTDSDSDSEIDVDGVDGVDDDDGDSGVVRRMQTLPDGGDTKASSRDSPKASRGRPTTLMRPLSVVGQPEVAQIPEISEEEAELWGSLRQSSGPFTGYSSNTSIKRATSNNEPLYDEATTNLLSDEMTEDDRKLRIAGWLGEVKVVTIKKSPTGLDMQIVSDAGYIRVAQVVPRGAAHRAGVQVGDVLLSCNEQGLITATVDEAETAMLVMESSQLEVAPLNLPLPEFKMKSGLGPRQYSVGAVSPSAAIRPLYCEYDVDRREDGTLGFTINTNGPEPIIDEVEEGVKYVKSGDIIKSVNGDKVTCTTIEKLLRNAETPVNLDLIRYTIDTASKPTQVVNTPAKEVLKQSNPHCDTFDATFKGRVEMTEKGTKMDKLLKTATKKVKKDNKLRKKSSSGFSVVTEEDTQWDEGKVKITVFSDAIAVKRLHPIVPKSVHSLSFVSDPSTPPPTVFNVLSDDIFTTIKNKRRILVMVQPEADKPMICYILKFPKKKECDKASVSCSRLSGHVSYVAKKKAKEEREFLSKRQLSKEAKLLKKKKSKSSLSSPTSSPSAKSSSKTPSPKSSPPNTKTNTNNNTDTKAGDVKQPRRKLVRGANAVEVKVLPEFQAALDALADLDTYLDSVLSVDPELALKTPQFSSSGASFKSVSNISRAKSLKLFRAYSQKMNALEKDAANTDNNNNTATINTTSNSDETATTIDKAMSDISERSELSRRPSSVVDESDDEDDDDDDISNLMSDDLLNALAEKRKQRALEQDARKAQLKALFTENRLKEAERRAEEEKKFDLETEKEHQTREVYKEYCAVGASRRLRELTFKFRFADKGAAPDIA